MDSMWTQYKQMIVTHYNKRKKLDIGWTTNPKVGGSNPPWRINNFDCIARF